MTIVWERTGRLPPAFVRLPERVPNNFRPSTVNSPPDGPFDQKGNLPWDDSQQDSFEAENRQSRLPGSLPDSESGTQVPENTPDPFFDDSEFSSENS